MKMTQNFEFGGVQFEIEEEWTNGKSYRPLAPYLHQVPHAYSSFMSHLVALTYEPQAHYQKQDVLDALSPFQVMSKMWAATLFQHLAVSPRKILYPGAWYGQLYALIQVLGFNGQHNAEHDLLDKDGRMKWWHTELLKSFTFKTVLQDLNQLHAEDLKEYDVVLWTGVEHFDNDLVQATVSSLAPQTLVILQCTDLKDEDHINPISETGLHHYFHDSQVLYKGELRAPFATRFCLAALT